MREMKLSYRCSRSSLSSIQGSSMLCRVSRLPKNAIDSLNNTFVAKTSRSPNRTTMLAAHPASPPTRSHSSSTITTRMARQSHIAHRSRMVIYPIHLVQKLQMMKRTPSTTTTLSTVILQLNLHPQKHQHRNRKANYRTSSNCNASNSKRKTNSSKSSSRTLIYQIS